MKKLRAWIESNNSLCLDLRSKLEFKSCHLKLSTNIPLSQLALRQAELPPKRLPFAVIEPLNDRGCSSWLADHGWQIPWVFWEGHFTWKDILANEWTAISKNNKKWLLFQPSPFLEKNIDLIEQNLLLSEKKPWRCLDIGCGAGRDIGWLLSRGEGKWRASAFDYLPGAMIRTEMIVRNLDVAQYLDILAQAKLRPDGQWKLISNAWWPINKDRQHKDMVVTDRDEEISKRSEMAKLECQDNQVLPFKEFYKNLLPRSNEADKKFDLILNIRFLSRPFLLQVPDLLNLGGYFIISHFVHDNIHEYKHPKRSLRLGLNEISDLYRSMSSQLEIVQDVIEESEDGRPINSVLVRRIS
jgi:SAM-dependent methyltransferase